jgi:hypothetical protein
MPDIIGDPAFVCLGLASAEDGLIVISLCEIFSKYLTALPGKNEFPVTPQHDKKRNLSDITISPSSAEAKPKHTKAGSPMMSGILNR